MVHREEHNENFTIIDNAVLQNVNLSFEARGFFAYLLSFPNDWSFSIRGIVKHSGTSESVVRRLLGELQAEGYVVINRHIDKSGRVTSWSWDIYEAAKMPHSTQMSKSPDVEITRCGESQMWNAPHVEEPGGGFTTCGETTTIQSTNNNKVLNKQSTKVKQRTKENKKNPLDDLSPELRQTFEDFMEMRKKIKAPLTDRGLELAIKRAKDLGGNDPEKTKAIVEQSIRNSWRGLFPIKEETRTAASKAPADEIDWEEVARLAGGET